MTDNESSKDTDIDTDLETDNDTDGEDGQRDQEDVPRLGEGHGERDDVERRIRGTALKSNAE